MKCKYLPSSCTIIPPWELKEGQKAICIQFYWGCVEKEWMKNCIVWKGFRGLHHSKLNGEDSGQYWGQLFNNPHNYKGSLVRIIS